MFGKFVTVSRYAHGKQPTIPMERHTVVPPDRTQSMSVPVTAFPTALLRMFRWVLPLLFVLPAPRVLLAQGFPFTSGPIPLCDTSTFTANVSGVGMLVDPNWDWGPYLQNVVLNITTDHPQTLQISLTSPGGTTLLLSAFNGVGGENYTNTNFPYWGGGNITTATAPFTGYYSPQGGALSAFNYQNADGVWTITVIDTACTGNLPGGTGAGWTPGWFNGAATGSGGFDFGWASPPPPPCGGWLNDEVAYICQGQTVDILGDLSQQYPSMDLTVYDLNYIQVGDPTAVGAAGLYYVEAFDQFDGCLYQAYFEVVVSAPFSFGPDLVVAQCGSAGPVDLVALFNTVIVNAAWSLDGSPITNATATAAITPGTYQLIGSNFGGCTDTVLVTLDITADPVLGSDQSFSLCPGGSVDLGSFFSTAGYTEEWTHNGAVFGTPEAATDPGAYILVATTALGCADTATIALTVDGPSALGTDQAFDLCANELLDLSVLYNTTGASASWTLSGVPVTVPTAVSAAGTYQLVVTSASNCTDTALVFVNAMPSPALGADAAIALCTGSTADLDALYTMTGLNTAWTLAGVAVPDPAAVDVAGTYTLVATNAEGCSDTALVQVSISTNPVLGPDQSVTVCEGTLVDLAALHTTGTNATTWSLNGVPIADPTAVAVSGTYTVVVTTAAGCADSATVDLLFNVVPELGNDQSATICAGDSFDLSALYNTTGLSTAWTLGAVAVSEPSAVSASGNYQLSVTNAFNCSDIAIVNLTVNTPSSLGPDQVFSICSWQSVDLSAVIPISGTNVTYTLNGQAVADPGMVTEAGSYMITVADASGCSDEAMATVIPIECLCEADFIEDAHCQQEAVQFTLVADSTIVEAHWDFHGTASNVTGENPEVSFFEAGQMLVTLHAALSCGTVTVERMVSVPDCSDACDMFIPTAFTPDGDGVNDGWIWQGECIPEHYSMIVFDRWGEQVFSSKDPLKAWDGMVNGKEMPSGVYPYRVNYRLLYQEPKEDVGTITLVR